MPRDPIVLNLRKHCLEKGWPFLGISEPEPLVVLDIAQFELTGAPPRVGLSTKSQTFIGYVENAQVIGDGFLVLEDGLVVNGLTHHNDMSVVCSFLAPYVTDGCFPEPLPQNGEIEEAVLCWGSENFGHWIFTYLHRLTLLWYKPELLSKTVLVKSGTPPRFVEWLYRMGFRDIIYGGDWVKIKKLWVPSVVHYRDEERRAHYFPEAIHAFRYLVLGDLALPHARRTRFFISRRKAKWRRVLNEEELIESLKKYDVHTVFMEDMSWEDQMMLVSRAQLIILAAGAASPITMLAPRGCKIIELDPPTFAGAFASKTWAHMLGQLFYRVRGIAAEGSHENPINQDYTIDVNEVIKLLEPGRKAA